MVGANLLPQVAAEDRSVCNFENMSGAAALKRPAEVLLSASAAGVSRSWLAPLIQWA